MTRLSLAVSLCFAACMNPPAEEPVRVSRWQDLTVESRSLRADSTFSAVGLRPGGARDDGSTEWETAFSDARGSVEGDFVRRDFRLTITNRGDIAREFHARIDYLTPQGGLLRRRSIDRMVVPPFTEMTWIGAVMIRDRDQTEVLARVLPVSEPFDPEETAAGKGVS